ncbi:MAG TPA: hypothetical protein ENF65_00410 [Euryarchaeota archaeon]|nr:MAG: hypothetical protein DRN46_06225 [Thermococci archaeon]RLF96111.1 MAG: hypothetical protein DRN52_02920 [Thermococci archaeon]HDI10190.1 hypothetical protein [Euryarchaeota archaeon]
MSYLRRPEMPSVRDERDEKISISEWNGERGNILIGIPFDSYTRGRPGARFAPQKIRSFLRYDSFNAEDWKSVPRILDAGDIDVVQHDLLETRRRIYSSVSYLADFSERLIVLGGDHSVTAPCLKGLREKLGEMGLIVLDSHLDIRELKGEVSSGSAIIDSMREGKINPSNVVEIGVRSFLNSKYYFEKAKRMGIRFYTSLEVSEIGILEVVREAFERASDGVEKVYLSVDVDVLDQSFAPGVNSAHPGGISTRELFSACRELGKRKEVIAIDFTEVNPLVDPWDFTPKVVAMAMAYFLSSIM